MEQITASISVRDLELFDTLLELLLLTYINTDDETQQVIEDKLLEIIGGPANGPTN